MDRTPHNGNRARLAKAGAVALLLVGALCVPGCVGKTEAELERDAEDYSRARFAIADDSGYEVAAKGGYSSKAFVMTDRETGIQYLVVVKGRWGIAVTPLLDSDGEAVRVDPSPWGQDAAE